MKHLIRFAMLNTLIFVSAPSFACDKDCQKTKDAQENRVFPKYVTSNYCRDVREDFLSSTLSSVDTFVNKKINTKYKGSIRNTRNYLSQHLSWVQECDDYLKTVKNKRIFHSSESTEQIYTLTNVVIQRFDDLLKGIVEVDESGQENMSLKADFKRLSSTVETHRDRMHMRGIYAFN